MNIRSSLKVMLLALVVGTTQADRGCDTFCDQLFDTNNWYITPKIGVAPTIFAGSRARQQFVVPRAAGTDEIRECEVTGACFGFYNPNDVYSQFANVLQEGPCLPKFSDMFHQGVLHVGVELGYQSCESSCPIFVEFVYNRARGRCVTPCDSFITNRASVGCTKDCNSSCNSSSSCNNNCCPTAPSISNICGLRDDYSNYTAYGAYIGGRHFTSRFWCDTTSFWFGYKVGILHRRQVNSCSVLTLTDECAFQCDSGHTQESPFNRAIFCKSNSVSGGVQIGFDYNYSDCLAFQLGFEVVASCGLLGNRNHAIDLSAFTDVEDNSIVNCSKLPSNILIRNTGTVVNFPIWFGIRWDFGSFCNPCNAC